MIAMIVVIIETVSVCESAYYMESGTCMWTRGGLPAWPVLMSNMQSAVDLRQNGYLTPPPLPPPPPQKKKEKNCR